MKLCCQKYLNGLLFLVICLLAHSVHAQQLTRPPITGIAYVQLQVSDIKSAGVFYHSLLGYEMLPGTTLLNNKNHFITIKVNQRQQIKLRDGLPAPQDERLMVLAFQTTDAEALRIYLQSKSVLVPAAVTKAGGTIFFSITDPDKHALMFVQYPANPETQTKQTIKTAPISNRILHAGLTIANMEAANAFYAGVLGFSEIWRGGATDSITSWINMRVPEGTDYLEYMLTTGPVNRQQLGGMHHIALMVPDMQQAVDVLGPRSLARKYTVTAPRIGRNKRWQLNLFDPDGTRIELMEPFTMR